MKKLILILLLIPAISYAVWYNPFSWFKKGQANISQSVKCEPKIVEKVVEKPIECKPEIKEVEKIVYKDNPKQISEIKACNETINFLTEIIKNSDNNSSVSYYQVCNYQDILMQKSCLETNAILYNPLYILERELVGINSKLGY